jgi:hypothetical protein
MTTLAELTGMAKPRLSDPDPVEEKILVRCDEVSQTFRRPPGTLEAARAMPNWIVLDQPYCERGLRLRYAWMQAHTWLVANNPEVMAADALRPAVIHARACLDAHVEICAECQAYLNGGSVSAETELP